MTWGINSSGELGNGTFGGISSLPVEVWNLTDVLDIKGGGSHCLSLKNDGKIWAWGNNKYGQVGNGKTNHSNIPVEVMNPTTNVTTISGGGAHTLALRNDGIVFAWGNNLRGQLGNESVLDNSTIPIEVLYITDVAMITGGGAHSLAIKNDGTVWAWGRGDLGQLGNGLNNDSKVPVQVKNLTNVLAIGAGGWHSLALKSDGTVWSWGSNAYGQLGDGTKEHSNVPVQVLNLTNVIEISASIQHSLALKNDGTIRAWGWNEYGQLGDGTDFDSNIPVKVLNISDAITIAAGGGHSLAVNENGSIWSWGRNAAGQLGNKTWDDSSIPVQVLNLTNVSGISAGAGHSLALQNDGTVWAWGANYTGQLGNGKSGPGTDSNIPIEVPDLNKAMFISAGDYHSLALMINRNVWAWGKNEYGQLGNGTEEDSNVPVLVVNI